MQLVDSNFAVGPYSLVGTLLYTRNDPWTFLPFRGRIEVSRGHQRTLATFSGGALMVGLGQAPGRDCG